MRKHRLAFALLTVLFVATGCLVKAKYYFLPYPNLIEYFLLLVLLVVTLVSLSRKNEVTFRAKLLTGVVAMAALMGTLQLLNWAFNWHPLQLNLPLTKSQSFQVDYDPYPWQTTAPLAHGYREEELRAYYQKLDKWDQLRALLVVKDGQLMVEKYFAGTTPRSAFNVHSVTKSVTAALVGLAIGQGHMPSENALVRSSFPEYPRLTAERYKKDLTIQQLLALRGGWDGGDGFQTVAQCLTEERLGAPPGTEFKYFTGSYNILSAILTKSTHRSTKAFADQFLFRPLGIKTAFWREIDGYYVGGDESYYTARDLARFGQLFLNRGNVDGRQVLDAAWVDKALRNYSKASKAFRSLDSYEEVGYGLGWWLLKTKNHDLIYAARGRGGQHILLIPDKNMVVVVLQEWNPLRKKEGRGDKLLGELLEIL